MLRLAAFALLGCSFLTVQARVVRERTLGTLGLEAGHQVNRSGDENPRLPALGGGTTRALHEGSDPRWASTATPCLAPLMPLDPPPLQLSGALVEVLPPIPSAAPPVLRI